MDYVLVRGMQGMHGCRPTVTDSVSARRRSFNSSRSAVWLAPRQRQGSYLGPENRASLNHQRVAGNNGQPTPSQQQHEVQQQVTPAADLPLQCGPTAPPALPDNSQQVLQQMASQQMLLMQQQVTLLTQLLQQSQQQNAALASQVQQVTQELFIIKQQILQQQDDITSDGLQQHGSSVVQGWQGDFGVPSTPLAGKVSGVQGLQQPQGHAAAEDTQKAIEAAQAVVTATAAAELEPAVQLQSTSTRMREVDVERAAAGRSPSLQTAAATDMQAESPDAEAAASLSRPSSGSDFDAAEAADHQLQQLRPKSDQFVRSVRSCSRWEQVRAALDAATQRQQLLEPWQLLAALRQLSGIMNSSNIDYTSTTTTSSSSSSSTAAAKNPSFATPGDLAANLLHQLLQHSELWSPVVPGSGCCCCLYPHEIKALLLSCAGLPLKLPYGSNQHLQALYEAALQNSQNNSVTPKQQQQSNTSAAAAAGVCQLSVDQQLQLLGACLVLGLKPHQQQLQLLSQLHADQVRQCSLLAAAFVVFATDAFHTTRVLANPAAAARVAGALPPDEVLISEVPVQVLAAALARVGAAGGRVMNAKLGARRMRQLLLLPLVRLKVHLPLLETQLQELQHQQQPGDAAEVTVQLSVRVRLVCEAIQAAMAAGLITQQQQQQLQQGQQQQLQTRQQQQQQAPQRTAHTRGRAPGRVMPGARSLAPGRETTDAPNGGWTVVTAAAALLLMGGQLGCSVKPSLLDTVAAAIAAQLSNFPDHLLLPIVQLMAASAFAAAGRPDTRTAATQQATDTDQQQQQQQWTNSNNSSRSAQPGGIATWRSAMLQHISTCRARLSLDQLLAVLLELTQHSTAAEARVSGSTAGSNNTNSSSNTLLSDCEALLATAIKEELDLVSNSQPRQTAHVNWKGYSSKQLARLLPQLAASGLSPTSDTVTALLKLILLGPQPQPQSVKQVASGPQPGTAAAAGCTTADLAMAFTAATKLVNPPDQGVMQQLAAAIQQDTGSSTVTVPAAAAGGGGGLSRAPGPAAPVASADVTAAEACELVCALASVDAAASRQNRSKLGSLAFTVYDGVGSLQGSQLAAFVAALAELDVPLTEPLGTRSLESRAAVSYGMVVSAAASAAALPPVLAATPAQAVAQLAGGVAALGAQPDDGWWRAVLVRLTGHLSEVGGLQLQQLLQGLLVCDVTLSPAWLDEACQAVLSTFQTSADTSGSLQQLWEQSSAATSRLVTCSFLLVKLGSNLPTALQEAIIAAVDVDLLQQSPHCSDRPSSVLQPAAAARLVADAGCALSSSGSQPPGDWLARYAAGAGQLIGSASGDTCCRLTVAVASLRCQVTGAWVREMQKQLEAKASAICVSNLCAALCSLRQLGAQLSPVLANALVIKTQEQLLTVPAAGAQSTAAGKPTMHSSSGSTTVVPGGLLATDLANAAWAVASAGVKLPAAWCSAAVKQLAAVADQLEPLALLQTIYAATVWKVTPVSKSLLWAVQHQFSGQHELSQTLTAEQLGVVATALLSAGQVVPQCFLPYLPADAAVSHAHRLSLDETATAAKLAEALWQEARTALKDSTPMSADILLQAAARFKGQAAAAVTNHLKPADKWVQLLQALAQQHRFEQQPQQHRSSAIDACALLNLQKFIQLVATVVQQAPATSRVNNGGPATLVALVVLEAHVEPAWVAAVSADLNSQATSKSSWFKQATASEVLAYMQAAAAVGQPMTSLQLEGLAKYALNDVAKSPPAQLLQLLELLPATDYRLATTAATTHQHAQKKQQQQTTAAVVEALLPALLAAPEASRLQQHEAQRLISALVRLQSSLLMGGVPGVDGSRGTRGGRKKVLGNSSAAQMSIDSVLGLLSRALGTTTEPQPSSSADIHFLLGCLQLAATVPAAQRPQDLCEQLLQLFVCTASQLHEPLHPHTAAQLFLPAVALTVTLSPEVAWGSSRPDAQLGGCLVQLLEDIESDWGQVGSAELAAMPKAAALVHLELAQPEALLGVILNRQQELAKAQASVVQEAAAVGGGPVQLLNAAVLQVMNKQPAEAGNSTWEGLHLFVSLQDSSQDESAETAAELPLMIPAVLFDATNVAVARMSNLSSSDLCDLLHCFVMAKQTSRNCTWMGKLSAPDALVVEDLNHNQQQCLLVIFTNQLLTQQEPPNPAYVVAVLKASLNSLECWPTAMLPYTLHILGLMGVRYVGDIPDQLAGWLLQWQAAAIAALAPRMHMLPAVSYVQLLQGCGRLKAALPADSEQIGHGTVTACLQAAALTVSGMLDQLRPLDYISLLHGLGRLEFAGPALAAEILACLQPHLSALSAEHLSEAGQAYATWPAASRPEVPVEWADAFWAAAQQHLTAAMPVSISNSLEPTVADLAHAGDRSALSPDVLLQLVGCTPFLSSPPSDSWRKQFMLVLAGQVTTLTASQAAEMLFKLSLWKGVQQCSGEASGNEAQAGVDAAFASYTALFDVLMLRVAGSGGIAPPGMADQGVLHMDAVAVLPKALRDLCWPPDEQIVQQILGYINTYQAKLQASVQKMEKALQEGKEILEQPAEVATSNNSSSRKQKSKQQQHKTVRPTKKQLAMVKEEVAYLENMTLIGTRQQEHLSGLLLEWEELLQQAEDLSSRVSALESSSVLTKAAPAAASSSAIAHGNDDRLAVRSTDLDLDKLMAGMMSAAGMSAAGSASVERSITPQSVVAPESDLDAVLRELERVTECLTIIDEEEQDSAEYIDTVAQDL